MKFGERLLDSLYPRCCPVCHRVLREKKSLVCRECLPRLILIGEPRCMKCGKTLDNPGQEYCGDCKKGQHSYDSGMAVYVYEEVMKNSMEGYKFKGRREYGDFYVWAMAHYGEKRIESWKPECIYPVPMLPSKERIRGFNQSQYLAKGLGEIFGISVSTNEISRIKKSKDQKTLTAIERRHNLQQAFCLTPAYVPRKSVLIVDDVYTTGSTIDALAFLLKQNHTQRVYFLTVSQGQGF